jgi:fucose permease
MIFERPALIRLTIIFGVASAFYALAGMLAMQLGDRLIARAQALHEMQTQIEREITGSIEIAPVSARPAAVR